MSEWHFAEGGAQRGPVSTEQLRGRLASGELPRDALVWRPGLPGWLPASQVPELTGPEAPPFTPGEAPPPSSPYAPPATDATAGRVSGPPIERRRPWPLSVISILWFLSGLLQAGVGLSLALASADETAVVVLGLVLGVTGLVTLGAGVGLWRLRPWGRVLAILVSCFMLINIPIGTLLGILLLIYLFSPGVKLLYSERPTEQLEPGERRELAAVGSSGLGVAIGVLMLVGLVFALAIIPAIALPNFLNAVQRGKQKRTMGDLRTAATAIESYRIDHETVPDGGPDLESIRRLLEPTYIETLPVTDGWNNPLRYEAGPELEGYRLESFGKDGLDSGPDEGSTTDFRHDIVFADGSFVSWPEGAQG